MIDYKTPFDQLIPELELLINNKNWYDDPIRKIELANAIKIVAGHVFEIERTLLSHPELGPLHRRK